LDGGEPGTVEIALALPLRDQRVLVVRRAAGSHLAGFWEFPGGKIECGEQPSQAAARELCEETGLVAAELEPLGLFVHEYPDRTLRFHAFLALDSAGELRVDGEREWKWAGLSELLELELPDANVPIVRALRWRIR
jgi:8-oxo-dGTP diphosphatase